MPYEKKPAFRCKTCGHLESAEHAGENDVPHACSQCGAGVLHNPRLVELSQELASPETTKERRNAIALEIPRVATSGAGEKRVDPDNWEVLADATKKRLKELGIADTGVTKHTAKTGLKPAAERTKGGATIFADAQENGKAGDKSS